MLKAYIHLYIYAEIRDLDLLCIVLHVLKTTKSFSFIASPIVLIKFDYKKFSVTVLLIKLQVIHKIFFKITAAWKLRITVFH